MCAVTNRIKVLDCKDFHDAEVKINDFLKQKEVREFVDARYMLEFGTVILEYHTFDFDFDNNNMTNRIINSEQINSLNQINPFMELYKFWFGGFLR